MKNAVLIVSCLVAVGTPSFVAAQTGPKPPTAQETAAKVEQTQAIKAKLEETQAGAKPAIDPPQGSRFVRTLTNVQVELTLTDQVGTGAPEKKTVSMIVSSGNWGKIRSAAMVAQIGDAPYAVDLNVDARPFVSVDGPIQLEMTLVYMPAKAAGDPKEGTRQRPSGINQSQTVVLQSGKSLAVSQAADPLSDRKVTVEVKATVLK